MNITTSDTPLTTETLTTRFRLLWQRNRLTAPAPDRLRDVDVDQYSENIFTQLKAMYDESWRRYHTFAHITACLGFFDAARAEANHPDVVEMALWFHDCIYVVGDPDNEAKSRDWFLQVTHNQLNDDFRNHVAELIMDTLHNHIALSADGKLVADIDLTSFGLPWDEYLIDGENVAAEMALIAAKDQDAEAGKNKFVDMLLQQPSIYHSPYYLHHFEAQAQTNIKRYKALQDQA